MVGTTTSSRRVSFNPKVRGVEIMSIDDFSASEISASWFSQQEMERITQRCFTIIVRMDQGVESSSTKKYCTRGLEGHSRLGSVARKRNRTTSIESVLKEQSRQFAESKFDEHALAEEYQKTASSCQMWAQVMGKRDEEVAHAIYFQNNNSDDDTAMGGGNGRTTQSTERITASLEPGKQKQVKKMKSLHGIYEPTGARAA